MAKKIMILTSILAFCYVVFLVVLSYIRFESTVIRAFGEFMTIPVIVLVVMAFIFSVVRVILKDKSYLSIMGINGFTMVILIVFSFIQCR